MVLDKKNDPEQTSAEEPGIAEIDQVVIDRLDQYLYRRRNFHSYWP